MDTEVIQQLKANFLSATGPSRFSYLRWATWIVENEPYTAATILAECLQKLAINQQAGDNT